jgi:hypothetical protein
MVVMLVIVVVIVLVLVVLVIVAVIRMIVRAIVRVIVVVVDHKVPVVQLGRLPGLLGLAAALGAGLATQRDLLL